MMVPENVPSLVVEPFSRFTWYSTEDVPLFTVAIAIPSADISKEELVPVVNKAY